MSCLWSSRLEAKPHTHHHSSRRSSTTCPTTNIIRSPLPKTRGILKLGTSKLCSLVYTPDLGLYRATLFPPALSKPAPVHDLVEGRLH